MALFEKIIFTFDVSNLSISICFNNKNKIYETVITT